MAPVCRALESEKMGSATQSPSEGTAAARLGSYKYSYCGGSLRLLAQQRIKQFERQAKKIATAVHLFSPTERILRRPSHRFKQACTSRPKAAGRGMERCTRTRTDIADLNAQRPPNSSPTTGAVPETLNPGKNLRMRGAVVKPTSPRQTFDHPPGPAQ